MRGRGVGQGDRKPGVKGEGSVWKAGKEMAGSGIPKVAGTERIRNNFAILMVNIIFRNRKRQRGGNH